jgi:hypothetical protein
LWAPASRHGGPPPSLRGGYRWPPKCHRKPAPLVNNNECTSGSILDRATRVAAPADRVEPEGPSSFCQNVFLVACFLSTTPLDSSSAAQKNRSIGFRQSAAAFRNRAQCAMARLASLNAAEDMSGDSCSRHRERRSSRRESRSPHFWALDCFGLEPAIGPRFVADPVGPGIDD